jgi:hypothetical protein
MRIHLTSLAVLSWQQDWKHCKKCSKSSRTIRSCCTALRWNLKNPMLAKVIEADSGHGYAWFQRGQIEESRGDIAAAKAAYTAGIIAAEKSGDAHARSELEGALSMIES